MLLLCNLLFPFAFILYLPVFIIKLVRRGGADREYLQRFGIFTPERRRQLKELDQPVWVHAVSVGEVIAACTFISEWRQRQPDQTFVLTTTTTTGHAVAKRKLPSNTVLCYCPLDFYPFVRSTLNAIRPSMLVIFEVEIWPNLIRLSARRDISVALVNARMSERSARGYAKYRKLFKPIFDSFSVICAQSEGDKARIKNVCGETVPVYVCNSMKFDQVSEQAGSHREEMLKLAFGAGDHFVWTAASTHAGEEDIILESFGRLKESLPKLKLILVPRHHERTTEVEEILKRHEITYHRFTDLEVEHAGQGERESRDCLLVNTTGVLVDFMQLSDVVFVGKSLAGNHGGHNIIEPAIYGKPIIHGPNMENFSLIVQCFRENEAAWEVQDKDELQNAVSRFYHENDFRESFGKRARQTVDTYKGAVDKTLTRILQKNESFKT